MPSFSALQRADYSAERLRSLEWIHVYCLQAAEPGVIHYWTFPELPFLVCKMGLGTACTSWAVWCIDNKQCMPHGKPSISVNKLLSLSSSPSDLAQGTKTIHRYTITVHWLGTFTCCPNSDVSLGDPVKPDLSNNFQPGEANNWALQRHWAKYTSNLLLCVACFILLAHLKPRRTGWKLLITSHAVP